jgi:hypothetical protein
MTSYLIPGETEFEVSRGLGKWKLKSIWNLGQQEKIGAGKLLTETLTKHAAIPVFAFSDKDGYGLISGGIKSSLLSIFSSYETNISMGDRIAIALFSFWVNNTKRVEINLSETSFLNSKVLIDGTNGYVVPRNAPESLLAVFADREITDKYPKFAIFDNTGAFGFSESLSGILEVLGGKVLSVTRGQKWGGVCEVRSKSSDISKRLSLLFGCGESKTIKEGNFDTEITIGENFAKDY